MAAPKFSDGSDEADLNPKVNELLQTERPWKLCADGQGFERTFKFKTFKAAWAFMNAVADGAKTKRHHPEWSNVYNTVFVRWTTHNPRGLSYKDVDMATLSDQLAQRPESQEVTAFGASEDPKMGEIVGQVTAASGDCCGSKELPWQRRANTEQKKIEEVEKEEGAQGSVAGMGGQPS